MKQKLFYFLCLTGLFPAALSVLQSVPHFYYLIQSPKTWSDAQTYCRKNYTDLATVTSTDDWMRLKKEAEKYNFTSPGWVGLYNDINSWRWSYQNMSLKKYRNWLMSEPNNYGGHEACAALDAYGNWWDLNCLNEKPFICFNANYTGSKRFIGISSPMKSWFDAQAYCREHYTDLATSNVFDNAMLMDLVQGQWSAWFGLFRDTWKWSDGSNASTINWIPGKPDNNFTDENCGSLSNGQIEDDICSRLQPFFCHIVPPVKKRQIVKLHMTSGQDVTDPAVGSSIIQMIERKLREQGLTVNITLTWRMQTDRKVFHKMKKRETHE